MIEKLKKYQLFQNQKLKSCQLLNHQGHCNTNYLLTTKDKKYLIRKFKLTNDRKLEFKIQKAIAKKNIGATPLLLDELQGLMVCEFIEGRHQTNLNRTELRKLAQLIKKLHKVKTRQKPSNLRENFTFKDKKALQALLKLKTHQKEPVLCHNDLHPQNILFGKTIKLIDWEYARVNDRYFDLASIVIEFRLKKEDERYFLRSYFGNNHQINHQKLALYKTTYRELWRLWFEKLDRGEL
jgi:thiamine kinase-like enzyme